MKSGTQKIIMRRVYYSYGLRIFSHTMFWRGVFLGVAAVLLAKWLWVAKIVHNLLSVPLGHAPQYMWNAFWYAALNGEFVTALVLVLAGGVAISAGYQLMHVIMPRTLVMKTV